MDPEKLGQSHDGRELGHRRHPSCRRNRRSAPGLLMRRVADCRVTHREGVSPGAAFVFLMVGPAMNAMSLTTVLALVGRKAAVAYLLTILVGAILCGGVINLVPNAASASLLAASTGHALSPVHWASAVFLAAMMVCYLVRPVRMGCRHG